MLRWANRVAAEGPVGEGGGEGGGPPSEACCARRRSRASWLRLADSCSRRCLAAMLARVSGRNSCSCGMGLARSLAALAAANLAWWATSSCSKMGPMSTPWWLGAGGFLPGAFEGLGAPLLTCAGAVKRCLPEDTVAPGSAEPGLASCRGCWPRPGGDAAREASANTADV